MRFLMLGPLEVRDTAGERIDLGGARQRTILAALLARARSAVTVDRLCEDVWGEALPANPEQTVRTCVSRLRATLGEPDRLVRRGGGYLIDVADDELDVATFTRLATEGRAALSGGDARTAAARLREGLALWRGEPLADLDDAPLLRWLRPRLAEDRLAAVEDRLDADLAIPGRERELVGELRGLVEQHPLREGLVAKLMRALHRCGRQIEALEVFESARTRLAEEFGLDPSEELRVLHTRILRHDPRLSPPRLGGAGLTAPPWPLTSFVGWEPDLRSVDGLLDRHRLVTLTGVGGSGKTRLALEVAQARASRHDDGVWFVPLAPVENGALIGRAVIHALGLPAREGEEERELLAYLRDRDALLVLDNCEHVRSAAAGVVERLLGGTQQLAVLTTGRQPLDAAGEHVWRVPPLRVPPVDAETIEGYEAVRLFVERARAVAPGFALDADTAPAVARVCRRLAGIPLGLELAAARVRSLSCAELADHLEGSVALLRSPSPTASERHRTLEATLDWSHDLLGGAERLVLRRLGVFRTPFPLSAVEAIATAEDAVPRKQVPDVLDRLVTASLVETTGDDPVGMRYRLLEPVRLYARQRLEADDRADAVRRAHAAWWWEQAAHAAGVLRHRPHAHPQLTRWFRGSVDDLRGALDWALTAGDAEAAQRLAGSSALLWGTYGLVREGVDAARRALAIPGDVTPTVRATALAGAALLEAHIADLPAAREHAAQAVTVLGRLPADQRPGAYADAVNVLAHVALWSDGDPDAADRLAGEAVYHGEQHDDGWALGYGRSTRAHAARWRGEFDEAAAILDGLLADMTHRDDPVGVIMTRYNLAIVQLERDHHGAARHHLKAALAQKQRTGADPFGQGAAHSRELQALARACLGQGDRQAARGYARQGLKAPGSSTVPTRRRRSSGYSSRRGKGNPTQRAAIMSGRTAASTDGWRGEAARYPTPTTVALLVVLSVSV